jgi:hypothetical protein
VDSEKFDFKVDSLYKTSFGVARMAVDTYKNPQILAPSFSMDVQPDNIGEIFASFFGTWTTGTQTPNAAGTQYHTTFQPAGTINDNLASVLFKVDYGQGTTYDYFGCRANKLAFSVTVKENLKCNADFIGQREVAGTSCPAAIAYGTFQPFDFNDMEIYIDGTIQDGISQLELAFDQKLNDGFRLGTQAYTTRPLPGAILDGNIKLVNEYNAIDRARYTGGTAVGITVRFIGQTIGGTGKNELKFSFPKVDYQTAPFDEKEGLMSLAILGNPMEGGTSFAGTGYGIQVDLFNTVNAY